MLRRALSKLAKVPKPPRARLVSTYYETDDRALQRKGLSLRVRERDGRFVQSVKSIGRGGTLTRGEWEDVIADGGPDPHGDQTGRFLKPGIGIFKRDNDNPLKFPTLPALNEGQRTFKSTKNSARFTQDLDDPQSGLGYSYVKTVTLVPGKPQMTVSHVLKNTGKKDIVTTVYCHNFLTLSPGSEHMVITAPFAWSAEKPLQPELVKLDGKTIRYIAPIPKGVTTISLMNGFGDKVSDYDFTVTNSKTGFGQRIRADQPIAKINMWSISPTYSLEPYIAIALKPGQSKSWTYTYDFFGPGEDKTK